MINVNLLPPEYRKVERTPVLRFVTIICGVILSTSAIGAFIYVHFGVLVKVVSEREKLQETYHSRQQGQRRSMALEREAKEYMKRRKTIEEIGNSRLLWSKKLDELCDLVDDHGDTKRYEVWLKQIHTLPASKHSAGGLFIKGFSGGSEMNRMSNFNLAIKKSGFFEDFASIDPPEGKAVKFSDKKVPHSAWSFDFNMKLKPFNQLHKGR